MDKERRLIIIFIGISVILTLVIVAVLVILERPVPEIIQAIAPGGLGLLAPSPLSKSTTPPDPPARPAAPPAPPLGRDTATGDAPGRGEPTPPPRD